MADPTLATAVCAGMEAAVNRALRYDPGTRHSLARLSGRVLAVRIKGLSFTCFLLPESDRLRILSHYEGAVDTRLEGSPLALAALLRSEDANLTDSGVEVFGSTGLLVELQKIAGRLDVDWEEALSEVLGDVAGHQGANGLRAVFSWVEGRRRTFERLLGEYLSEELRATPARAELEYYCREVDGLRLAADRLEARINALLAKKAH